MNVIILTDDNLIYILYNKREQDLYNSEITNELRQESIHDEYKFFYNIYSIENRTAKFEIHFRLIKAELINNKLLILFKSKTNVTELNSYYLNFKNTIHETKIVQR